MEVGLIQLLTSTDLSSVKLGLALLAVNELAYKVFRFETAVFWSTKRNKLVVFEHKKEVSETDLFNYESRLLEVVHIPQKNEFCFLFQNYFGNGFLIQYSPLLQNL